MKVCITIIAAAAATLSATAQGLHQEIEVEREITPVETESSRYNLRPELILPPVTPIKLSLSDRAVTAPVRPSFTHLSPVSSTTGLETDDYPGYVRAGIFPIFNADVSAGYRFLNTDRTRLNAWLQYTGDVYRRDIPGSESDRRYWRDNAVVGGVDLHQAVGQRGLIDAGAAYAYDRYNMYGITPSDMSYYLFNQWVHRFNADATYTLASTGGASFKAGLHFERFSFGLKDFVPAREHVYRVDLGTSIAIGEKTRFNMGLDGVIVHSSVHKDASTRGLITFRPAYSFFGGENKFSGKIGLSVSAAINDGTVFSIAPDIMLGWNPSTFFSMELTATGGAKVNTLSQLYELTPYMYSGRAYRHSNIPYDLGASIIVGPVHGLYARLSGSYSRATDWLMPDEAIAPQGHGIAYRSGTVRGWQYSGAIGWKHRYFKIEGSYAQAPSGLKSCYYQWRDRARRVVKAGVEIYPMEKLTIAAGYELRQSRAVYAFSQGDFERIALGNAASLSARVDYRVSRSFTVWASGDNLLNYDYIYLGDRPAQDITGMVGIELKF